MKNSQSQPAGIDGQRYVRVTNVLHNKFVEFEFAIDDPTINVELVLPFEHFREFCKKNNAKHLTAEQGAAVDYDKLKWRFGVPVRNDNDNN